MGNSEVSVVILIIVMVSDDSIVESYLYVTEY